MKTINLKINSMKFPFSIVNLMLVCFLFISCKNNSDKQEEDSIIDPVEQDSAVTTKNNNQTQENSSLTMAMNQGKQVYEQNCVVCHQSSGGGVPNMNPPLKGTDYVLGDKNTLTSIILKGSSAGLKVNGVSYSNSMPAFAENLDDAQIANVLTYIRNSFGNNASLVSEEEVKAVRNDINN